MAKRTVEVLLKAKDQTKKAVDSADKGFKGLQKSILNSNVALAAAGVAAAAMGRKIVKAYQEGLLAATEFQSAVAEVNTLLDADAETVSNLSNDLQDLAVKFGQVDTVMAKAQYNVVSAGFGDISESMKILEVASKAAIGGISDVNTAALLITQTLNAYEKEAEDAAYVSDLLFQTVKGGVIDFTQLAHGLGKVSGTAAAANISLEELLATVAVVTKKGVIAEEAFTSINALIVALGAASGEQKKVLDELGITLEHGLAPALSAIDAAGGDSLEVLAQLVPNIRALKAAAAAGAEGARELKEQLDEMADAAGANNEAYEKLAKTVKHLTDVSEAAAKRLSVAFGEQGMAAEIDYLNIKIKELGQRTEDMKKFGGGVSELAENWAKLKGEGEEFLTILTRGALVAGEGAAAVWDFAHKSDELKNSLMGVDEVNETLSDSFAMVALGVSDVTAKYKEAETAAEQYTRQAEENAARVEASMLAIAEAKIALSTPDTKTTSAAELEAGEALANNLQGRIILYEDIVAAQISVTAGAEEWKQKVIVLKEQMEQLHAIMMGLTFQSSGDEAEKLQENIMEANIAADGLGQGLGALLVDAPFKAMTDNAISFADAAGSIVVNALKAIIKQLLVVKAIGFFGGLLGLKEGGQIPGDLGNVSAYAQGGQIPRAAYGYSVPDGMRGRDSRLIMAEPGEEVINRDLSRRLNRFITAQESASYASPYGSGGSSGGGSTVVMNVGIPDSMAGLQRMTDGIVERLSEGGEI